MPRQAQAVPERVAIRCSRCNREQQTKAAKDGGGKLPPNWKRYGSPEEIWCRDCWHKSFILRAVTIPVASVIDGEWPEFLATLKPLWKAACDISNWAVTELARHDTPRTAAMERLAKMPELYLYPGAREVAPNLDPSSVVAVLHAVEGKYRKARLKTLWFRTASHPVYRYPCPLPIHNQSWRCEEGSGGRAMIAVRINAVWWRLALGTARHRMLLGAWRQVLSGRAVQGELALIGQEVTASDHRQNGEIRQPGGGRRKTLRIMAKMVAWFPRKEEQNRRGMLCVRTASDHFWVYHVGIDGEPRYLDAQHVRRWVAKHKRHNAALANDLKHEKRWPKAIRQQAGERQDIWCDKEKDRIDTFIHEATAMLANFADRQNVAIVQYDPGDKSYVESFPWHQLEEKLSYKLDERGIELVILKDGKQPDAGDENNGAE